jgi:hypothetical protein
MTQFFGATCLECSVLAPTSPILPVVWRKGVKMVYERNYNDIQGNKYTRKVYSPLRSLPLVILTKTCVSGAKQAFGKKTGQTPQARD